MTDKKGPDYRQNVLLAAAGIKTRLEEDPQSSQPRIPTSKKQYLFLFMCLIQWLMLVGYTRSTIYLH
ncbi:hypothetical protein GWI33_011149 [Rhynchophorus ferrugineus]|uniref:Uncharacterized protein n=1 Tax=Rhynchophorus ferrugineus TaxID=354439 RepID=A0A834IC52_RHYFE|nr:hypothetical protein GWI33_011149 [Rhynchophorus ferrugineus]